ncbi:MAG: hypothetical protein ACHQ49_07785 [Elusimicrobiota bacterium]
MKDYSGAWFRATPVAGALALAFMAGAPAPRAGAETAGTLLVDRVNNGTYEKRPDGTILWPKRYFGITADMDWSAYDFVELTLYNSGAQSMPFSFEVKDSQSNGYWTRVNLPQILGPGLQTIRLPTRLRVGEPGRPGRPLDPAKVVSLILARDDENDRTPVEVRRIELKKSARTTAPGVLAFHVGPEDAGIVDGFEPLTEKTVYSPAKKWGWLERDFWTPYPQANRVVAPDRLTSGDLTIASAKLRVDLKPGAYRVWMIIDHPGGFWGEFPYFHRRTVKAQGKLVLDESMTPERAKADYFQWQDAEDRESDDLFDRYWSKILKEKTFDARVENGHLDLEFANEDCPSRVSCFGMAPSALVVYPIDTEEQRGAGTRWLAKLRESRRAEFHAAHQLKAKALTQELAAMPPGLRAWNVAADLDLSRARPANLLPFSDSPALKPLVSVFRNSRGYFAPAVSWKGAAAQEISWRIDGIPDDVAVEGGWIKYRALRDSYTGNLYSVRERWVTDEKRRAFAREDLGRLWLRFAAPAAARAGSFPATLVLNGGPGGTLRVPFTLRVFKAQAAELDFPVGPFEDNVAENWWDAPALRDRLARLEKQSLAKLRSLGMTAFSFHPRMSLRADGLGVELDAREVDRVMTLAKQMGFQGAVGYNDVFLGENLCSPPGPDSVLSGTVRFRKTVDELESRARANRWLPLALIACDEPVGSGLKDARERLADLPPIDARRLVQWSVTASLGRYATSETRALIREVSLPFISDFAPGEIDFPWAFYNNTSRRTLGLEMFRLRQTTDMRYRLMWVWNQNLSNPYFDFDSRESDAAWCSSTSDARLRCSVDLDRTVDRGLADYRVALGLKRALEERKDLSPARKSQGLDLLKEAQAEGVDADAWLLKAGEFQEKL